MTDRRFAAPAPAAPGVPRSTTVSAPTAATTRRQPQPPRVGSPVGNAAPSHTRARPSAQTGGAPTRGPQPTTTPAQGTGPATHEVSSHRAEDLPLPALAAPSHANDLGVRHRKARHTMIAVTAVCASLASVPAIEQLFSRGLTSFVTRPAGVGASKSVVAPSTAGKADTTPTTASPPRTPPRVRQPCLRLSPPCPRRPAE